MSYFNFQQSTNGLNPHARSFSPNTTLIPSPPSMKKDETKEISPRVKRDQSYDIQLDFLHRLIQRLQKRHESKMILLSHDKIYDSNANTEMTIPRIHIYVNSNNIFIFGYFNNELHVDSSRIELGRKMLGANFVRISCNQFLEKIIYQIEYVMDYPYSSNRPWDS